MGGNLTASSIRRDKRTVTNQTDHALSTIIPLLPISLSPSHHCISIIMRSSKLNLTSNVACPQRLLLNTALGVTGSLSLHAQGRNLQVAETQCHKSWWWVLMVRVEMNGCTSSSSSCKLQRILQEGQDDLESVLVLLNINKKSTRMEGWLFSKNIEGVHMRRGNVCQLCAFMVYQNEGQFSLKLFF